MRTREVRFVEEFFARFLTAFPDLADLTKFKKDQPILKEAMLRIAAASLQPAGYTLCQKKGVVGKDGQLTTRAKRTAEYLLHMPRIQAALEEKFESAGFTADRAIAILAEIAEGKTRVRHQQYNTTTGETVELESDITPGDRLRAVDMRFRLTTGYAPSKTASVSTRIEPDAFFNPDEYAETPPIALAEQAMKTVSPPKPAPQPVRRARKKPDA